MLESDHGPVDGLLHEVWQSVRTIDSGQVADYIPELAKADPATCGLSLATLDGAVYTAGDLVPFTIQSVSKPFVYALALADSGAEAVLSKIGAEPTGDPFNTISLDDVSGRAFNPMVNAGAIVTATLVAGRSRAEQFDRILDGLSAFAGRALDVDEDVYASERDTGDRNRAIAYLMRSAGLLDHDVDDQVEMYFRQCSIVVTARDLAVMAATLANAGVNPTTGEQVIPRHVVAPVLTVMSTCGMYDYAGEWLYRVGMPAKSGVSGAISAVLPGQMGLAAHSPRLDPRGNSVRGVAACEQLSSRLGLHLLLPTERSRPNIRRTYRGDLVRSRRTRPAADRALLEAQGRAIVVHELVGDQGFAGVESLVRTVLSDPEPARWRVLDMGRVTRIDVAARTLLSGLVEQLQSGDMVVGLVEPRGRGPREVAGALGEDMARFADSDSALGVVRDAAAAQPRHRGVPRRGPGGARRPGPAQRPSRRGGGRDREADHHAGVHLRHGGLQRGRRAGRPLLHRRRAGQRRRAGAWPAGPAPAQQHGGRLLVRGVGARRRPATVHPDRRTGVDHLLRALTRGFRGPSGRGTRRMRPADPGDRPESVAAVAGIDVRGRCIGGVLTSPLRMSPHSG